MLASSSMKSPAFDNFFRHFPAPEIAPLFGFLEPLPHVICRFRCHGDDFHTGKIVARWQL